MNKTLLFTLIGTLVVGTGGFFVYKALKGSDKHIALIPADAAFVVTFDLKTLSDKSEMHGRLKETKAYKMWHKETEKNNHDTMETILADMAKNPLTCGINFMSKLYFFTAKDSIGGDYFALVADVKDDEALEATIGKYPTIKNRIKSTDNYKYVALKRKSYLIWNSNGAILVEIPYEYRYSENQKLKPEMFIEKIMSVDKTNSMAANKAFNEWDHQNCDITAFVTYSQLTEINDMMMLNPVMSSLAKSYDGLSVGMGLTFDKNRISFTSKTFGSTEKINMLKAKGVDDAMLQCMTNDKILAMACININLSKMAEMFGGDAKNSQRILDDAAHNIGLSNGEELKSVFDGQMTFAMVDIVQHTDSSMGYDYDPVTGMYQDVPQVRHSMEPVMTMNIGIKNRQAYDKIMASKFTGTDSGGIRSMPMPFLAGGILHIVNNEKGVMLTNHRPLAEQVAANKKLDKKPEQALCDIATGKPTSLYMDLDLSHYPAATSAILRDDMGEKDFNNFKNYMAMFKDVRGSGDIQSSQIDITLNDGDGNALYRIFKQMDLLPIGETPNM